MNTDSPKTMMIPKYSTRVILQNGLVSFGDLVSLNNHFSKILEKLFKIHTHLEHGPILPQ